MRSQVNIHGLILLHTSGVASRCTSGASASCSSFVLVSAPNDLFASSSCFTSDLVMDLAFLLST